MNKIGRDIQHYTPLFALLLLGLVGFAYFSYDHNFQSVIVIAMAAGYVSWGLIHHHIHQDLYLSVILEYVAIGALGAIIVLTILLNA